MLDVCLCVRLGSQEGSVFCDDKRGCRRTETLGGSICSLVTERVRR